MSRLQRSLLRILADLQHGSSVLVRQVADEFSTQSELTEDEFVTLARGLLSRRPAFALLHHFLHFMGEACFGGRPSSTLPDASTRWLAQWQRAQDKIESPSPPAEPLLIVTWSHSGTVRQWLARLARGHRVLVHCGRSLPGGEGELLASELARFGVSASVVEDDDALSLARTCPWTVVGADLVRPGEFWNKVGTERLVREARAASGTVFVVAETMKWCHPDWRVGSDATGTLKPVDSQLVSSFLCDRGRLEPARFEDVVAQAPRFQPLTIRPTGFRA